MSAKHANTPIRASLVPASYLLALVEPGLGAVKKADHKHFTDEVRATFVDSVDLDTALQTKFPEDPRWDYLLGHQGGAIVAVEPHSARQDQIDTILRKRKAALEQLRPHLRDGTKIAKWLWVSSGTVQFADTEKVRRRLDSNGIEFVGKEIRAKHLPPAPPAKPARGKRPRSTRAR